MVYRRPPSDVESMVSLRVDNLPYRAVPEVEINSACVISENRRFCCIIVFIFQDLKPLFEKYGDVGDIYLPTERGTGRSRGFAFVRYYDRRDAEVFWWDQKQSAVTAVRHQSENQKSGYLWTQLSVFASGCRGHTRRSSRMRFGNELSWVVVSQREAEGGRIRQNCERQPSPECPELPPRPDSVILGPGHEFCCVECESGVWYCISSDRGWAGTHIFWTILCKAIFLTAATILSPKNILLLNYITLIFFLIKDALDELNGRTYDGRELRIKIDEGRPK